jgi:hypothetical protein
MRVHYLVSITAVNLGLLIVLAIPFTRGVESLWLPFTAVPYYLMYLRDLMQLGYRATDLLRVYALNLLLIPVNLGGVLKSVQQAWTRGKIPFARTPKVEGRTAASAVYIAAEYALVLHWLVAAGFDFAAGRPSHGAFAVINAGFLLYAIAAFVGLKESREDLLRGLPSWLVPERAGATRAEPAALPPPLPDALEGAAAVTGRARRGARAA